MFYKLAKKRRSIRKYTDRAVEKDKLDSIVKSALLAPSSRGIRPCKYIIVDNKELLTKLSLAKEHGSQFLKDAPLAIIICGDTSLSDVWIEDGSIISTHVMLAAEDLGLGSCWVQVRNRYHSKEITSEDYIRNIFNIPANVSVLSIMAVGYALEDKPMADDPSVENVFINGYGLNYCQ